MADYHDEYRTSIIIHSTTNDFASLITQTPARFGTIFKYPVQGSPVSSFTGLNQLAVLSLPNHKMINFAPADRQAIELTDPLASFEKDSVWDIRTYNTGELQQFPSVPGSVPLFMVDQGSTSLPLLSHPEVTSTNFERYAWTYKGRTTSGPFGEPWQITGTTVSYLTKLQGHTGSSLFIYASSPADYSEIGISPIDSDVIVIKQAMIESNGQDGGRLFNIAPPLVGDQSVAAYAQGSGPNWNLNLPTEIIRNEQLPANVGQRAIWQIAAPYTHAGHRRQLPPTLANTLDILPGYSGSTMQTVTLTGDDNATIHGVVGFVWGSGNTLDDVPGNQTLIGIKPSYPHTLLNVEAPYPPDYTVDEGAWTLLRNGDVYTLHNRETTYVLNVGMEVQSGYATENGKAFVRMFTGTEAAGTKAYLHSQPSATSHPDYPNFTLIEAQVQSGVQPSATVWCVQAV